MNKKLLLIVFLLLLPLSVGLYIYSSSRYTRYMQKLPLAQTNNINSVKVEADKTNLKDLTVKIPAKVTILNGTKKIGITGKFEKELMEKMEVEILAKENAVRGDYPRSFVVDVKGQRIEEAKKIAYILDCPLTEILPVDEATPAGDILVILGEDYR